MNKKSYEKQVEMLMKESKEELIQRILSMEDTQTHDMLFAKDKLDNGQIHRINLFFEHMVDISSHMRKHLYPNLSVEQGCPEELNLDYCNRIETAAKYWADISEFLDKIAEPTRIANELKTFKEKINDLE